MLKELEKIFEDILNQGNMVVEQKYGYKKHLEFARDGDGDSLLNYAIWENRLDLVQFFVEMGASPFVYNINGVNAIMLAAGCADTRIVDYLVTRFIDGLTEYDQCVLLAYASAFGQRDNVRYLLEKGFDCNAVAVFTEEPILIWALQSGDIEIVRMLYEAGALVNACNEEGHTPLYNAAAEGKIEIMEYLINRGAKVNKAAYDGCTPLIIASCYDQKEAAAMLISRGANVNAVTKKGKSSLLYAMDYGHVEIVRILASHGVSTTLLGKRDKDIEEYIKSILNEKISEEVEMAATKDS